MTTDSVEFPVDDRSDRPIPGLAERHRELVEEGRPPAEVVATLEREVEERSVVAQRRGLATDLVSRLGEILAGRRLVEHLGSVSIDVTWLTLEAPHESKVSLSWKGEGGGKATFGLQVLGSGLAGGRDLSWSVTQSLEPRATSVRFTREIVVDVNEFETPRLRGSPLREIEVSVVRAGPVRISTVPSGEAVRAAELDRFQFDAPPEEAIDLSSYDAVLKEERVYRATGERTLTLALPTPKLGPVEGFKAELNATVTASAELCVGLELAPGFMHQPYWSRQGREPLPRWALR